MTQRLDPSRVPPEVACLLPLAEKWGISDDIQRTEALDTASQEERQLLAHCLDEVDDEALFEWLAGPDSYSSSPTPEYLAVTCLTMVVDLAKQRLESEVSKEAKASG